MLQNVFKDISIHDLAFDIGVSHSTLTKYLTGGKSNMKRSNIEKIESYLYKTKLQRNKETGGQYDNYVELQRFGL